jgi:FAD/FMN-containing dehydrogenase
MPDIGIGELATAARGQVVTPGEDGYEEGRRVWNGRFDRCPAAVIRCHHADDVRTAVDYARRRSVPLAVKGGGHSNAGHSSINGGLLIDLSPMKDIEVDPVTKTARVQPGVRWGEFNPVAEAHGLATPGGTVSSVGVAGFTLGGGTGYLVRKYGMAIDNLLSVEVVTADGRFARASSEENPDLFWAIRGGGGNFGVVTSFEFRLHEVGPQVLAGQIMHRFDGTPDLLRFFRDFMARAPEEMQCYPFFLRIPPIDAFPKDLHGEIVLDFVVFHTDGGAAGEAAIRPLIELGDPVMTAVGPQSYSSVMEAFDAGLPAGQRYGSRAHYLDGITDGVIDTIMTHVPGMAGALTVAYLEPLGGAAGRVDPSATAFPHRDAAYSFHLMPGWMESAHDAEVMAWAKSCHGAMARHATGGVYVNLLGPDEQDRIRAAYGTNYDRLVDLKRRWDPENLFGSTYNIDPAG